MSSKDPINEKANAWMKDEGIQITSGPAVALPKPQKRERPMSALLMRLARRLGKDPDELVKDIPADNIRRSKYPVLEQKQKDGTRTFEHDLGITHDVPISRP